MLALVFGIVWLLSVVSVFVFSSFLFENSPSPNHISKTSNRLKRIFFIFFFFFFFFFRVSSSVSEYENHPLSPFRPRVRFRNFAALSSFPVLSVVTATQNPRSVFLRTAFFVLNQSLASFEWTIVDDHSTNNVWEKEKESKKNCANSFSRLLWLSFLKLLVWTNEFDFCDFQMDRLDFLLEETWLQKNFFFFVFF